MDDSGQPYDSGKPHIQKSSKSATLMWELRDVESWSHAISCARHTIITWTNLGLSEYIGYTPNETAI